MRFGSLFSGIGGFDLGLERAGHECVWQVEWDKQAASVLARHWPNVNRYEDVRDVGSDSLAAADLICGGFPCQDLSVAGRRAGLDGDRSGLWHEFHRIVGELLPRWVLVENVPGLLSSNGGEDLAVILRGLADFGYVGAWRILDSRYFGVPQRRRRVFLLACRDPGERSPAEILAISEGLSGHPAPSGEEGEGIAGDTAPSLAASGRGTAREDGTGRGTPIVATETGKGWWSEGAAHLRAQPGGMPENVVAFDTTQITSKLNRNNPKPGDPCHPLAAGAHAPAIAQTITAEMYRSGGAVAGNNNQGVRNVFGAIPRRLLPIECERLQGFPDGWTEGHADGPRYRMLGNAVTVNVAEWIGRRLA